MNLHEYQGKEILSTFGVKIQKGIVVNTPQEAVAAAKKLTEETGTGWHGPQSSSTCRWPW